MNTEETVQKILAGELRYKHYMCTNEVREELKNHLNNSYALLHLGRYRESFYRDEAIKYYQQSIALGNSTAMVELAKLYSNGWYQKSEIINLLNKACELKDLSAYYTYGHFYRNGLCVEQNLEKAFDYFYKSHKHEYPFRPFEGDITLTYLFDKYCEQRTLIKKQRQQIDELAYAPGGDEYEKAKSHFESLQTGFSQP